MSVALARDIVQRTVGQDFHTSDGDSTSTPASPSSAPTIIYDQQSIHPYSQSGLDSIHLVMLHRSEIPWFHRFKATHGFSSRDDDAAARTAMKRNFFSSIWTILLSFYTPSFSGIADGYLIVWTIFSFAAILTPFLALWCSNGDEMSALSLAVKAQEMGDERGQKGELLGNLVNGPWEWRKKFLGLEAGFAYWIHGILFACVLVTQQTVTFKDRSSDTKGTVTNQDFTWIHWLSAVGVVPLVFRYGLALALFCMWCAPDKRTTDVGIPGSSAVLGSLCFAHTMKEMGCLVPGVCGWVATDCCGRSMSGWLARRRRDCGRTLKRWKNGSEDRGICIRRS